MNIQYKTTVRANINTKLCIKRSFLIVKYARNSTCVDTCLFLWSTDERLESCFDLFIIFLSIVGFFYYLIVPGIKFEHNQNDRFSLMRRSSVVDYDDDNRRWREVRVTHLRKCLTMHRNVTETSWTVLTGCILQFTAGQDPNAKWIYT